MKLYAQWPGEPGIYQTVGMMKNLVNESYLHPVIRDRAVEVTSGCNGVPACEDMAVLGYVGSIMRYVKDPTDIEALHHPVTWIERRIRQGEPVYGDCDDMTTYIASLLKSIGHRPSFRVIGRKDKLHHVQIRCHMILDPTLRLGEEVSTPRRAIQFPI